MNTSPIALRKPLPCDVPPGGLAVVLADGRVVPEGVQGPGELRPDPWRKYGHRLEAVLFPATSLRLSFDLPSLRSAEGVSLDLSVTLALRIADPIRFLADVVRDAPQLSQEELCALLRDTLRSGLAPVLRRRRIEELDADLNLRGWLGTAIEHTLRVEADLAGRSGLEVLGVDAYDLRCQVLDEIRQVRETYYLKASVAEAELAGRRLVDERLLAQLRELLPIQEEVVAGKERLAELAEQEAAMDRRLQMARRSRQEQLQAWIQALRRPPTELRPELWRCDLGEEVLSAPLCDGERVYVATRRGRVHAFSCADGKPAWPQPVELGTSPGDGLALAAGSLWAPGHDGILYRLDPDRGVIQGRIPIGGRLSSAPVPAGGLLLLSVDVDPQSLRPGHGSLVAVDPGRGQLRRTWRLSEGGLRAAPVVLGEIAYVGDRRGRFYAVDLRRDRVETLPLPQGGRIMGPALADEERGRVIVGDSYGRVVALDQAGRIVWQQRVAGQVVGQPLLHAGLLFVGASDGRLYALDPARGDPVREPFATGGPIAASPAAWGNLVFVASNDGYLYALEAQSGRRFWSYYSGSPIPVSPAVTADGRLFVVDHAGHLNALRWCLARYAEAARRLAEAPSPPWDQVAELWLLAGDVEAALQAARQVRRLDLVAELALGLNWNREAAQAFEQLAHQAQDPLQAAPWWQEAARAWELEGDETQAARCRRQDAEARGAPLLVVETNNLPQLTQGQEETVQVRVRNLLPALACDVRLTYQGDVQRAGEFHLGSIGPGPGRLLEIPVAPSEAGSATLRVTAWYNDSRGNPQPPARLDVRLKVVQPAQVHQHFYGPYVGRDGVIIMRGGTGAGRTIRVQSGADAITLERGANGERLHCPACGAAVAPGDRFCHQCRQELRG